MPDQTKETITITDFSSQGLGVGRRSSGQVAMIACTVPGDKVEVDFKSAKSRGIAFGRLIEIVSPSGNRTVHPCTHYSDGCKGSSLGIYDYQKELIWKRDHLRNTLERIGKLESPDVRDIQPSPLEWYYRDRLEFQLHMKRGRIQIGYMGDDGIIPVNSCSLGVISIQNSLQEIWKVLPTLEADANHEDFRILLRDNGLGKAVAALFIEQESTANYQILKQLLERSNLAGWEIRQVNDFRLRFFSSRLIEEAGETSIFVNIGGKSMQLPLLSFTQTNPSAAEILRKLVTDLIQDKGNLLDLYGGYGAFALQYVIQKSGRALVLESSHSMVESGRKFTENEILPIRHLQSDLNFPINNKISHGKFDSAIVDPPRDGLHRSVTKYLNGDGPPQLIYVSCHTAALARDLRELKSYTTEYFIPVDMFPNTPKLETIALLRKSA